MDAEDFVCLNSKTSLISFVWLVQINKLVDRGMECHLMLLDCCYAGC